MYLIMLLRLIFDMAQYTHEAGSLFPETLITLTNYKNADSTVEALLLQIKTYQDSGDYDSAQQLIDENINTLRQYVLDTAAINRYVEEIRNLEIYTKTHKQQIFYQSAAPSTYVYDGDIWIGN